MRIPFDRYRSKTISTTFILVSLASLLALSFTGCTSDSDQSSRATQLKETELEIHVAQTLKAQQSEIEATQRAIIEAQSSMETQVVLAHTATAQAISAANIDPSRAQETAQQATQLAEQTSIAAQVMASTPEPPSPEEWLAKMKTANILLFEDMTNNNDTTRYVRDTLDEMGLPYKDDGSAKGWLRSDIQSGGPDGEPWDLVILALETKSGPQGEVFEYVLESLDQGSSVILEVWFLDQTYLSTASALMARCGVKYYGNLLKIPPARMVMFPLVFDHPVLNEPNSGLTFTDTMSYWWDDSGKIAYDTGDLMQFSVGGDATLLLGTQATEKSTHGTLTVCMGDRLIMQTFSSHNLTFETMQPVWENYIYNALKVRLLGQQ